MILSVLIDDRIGPLVAFLGGLIVGRLIARAINRHV